MTMVNNATSSSGIVNGNGNGSGKQSVGRKKIEIKRIESKSSLQVSFSKRRAGLFKKAGELCVLCGAEVAIIVKSPGHKVFAFGHPSVNAVLDRYFAGEGGRVGSSHVIPTHEYNRNYAEAHRQLQEEMKNVAKIDVGGWTPAKIEGGGGGGSSSSSSGRGFWWESPIQGMELDELEQFHASLKELRKSVGARMAAAAKQEPGPMSSWTTTSFPGVDRTSNHVVLGDHVMGQTGDDGGVGSIVPHGLFLD